MKRKRFSEEQIIGVLKEGESGIKVDDLCRRHGMSSGTYDAWRNKFGAWKSAKRKGCVVWKKKIDD